ncbi:MAG: Na+/H+ antiporter NhaC [Leuconostoc fallax]
MMQKKHNLIESTIILGIIITCIAVSVIGLHLSPVIAVLFAVVITMIYAFVKRYPLSMLNEGIMAGVKPGIIPIFIFILVGALIAVWIKAGIIPSLMVFGFDILSVKFFVPSVFIVCAVVGSAIGSAFTVMSTIGIAFFGIGTSLGLSQPLIVGAIVSGAVFGDKMSPLSESTNLASAVVGADLFEHIKNLMWSTVPAFIISLILFTFFGLTNSNATIDQIEHVKSILMTNFNISWLAVIPILFMFLCAWRKIPAIFTILLNILLTIVIMAIQNDHFNIIEIAKVLEHGYVAHTGNEEVNILLSRGGIESMMPTVALIIVTLSLGGILMKLELISPLMTVLAQKLERTGSLVLVTLFSAIGVNIFVGEQFLSVILPGNAFKPVYDLHRLKPVVLGRVLEDGGTVINYLIPWGVAGSFVAGTFHVATMDYLPFVFFSLLSPLFSALSGFTGIGIHYQENK